MSSVGKDQMRISWITRETAPSKVEYGLSSGVYNAYVDGSATRYKYILYQSGYIHEAVIGPLQPNTVYYYQCNSDASREFRLKTAPAQLPIKFIVIGIVS